MAEDKDSLLDLKSELSALSSDLGDGVPEEEADIGGEMMDLKNRMDKSDQEMRAMTEAMKSTLLDVRALMQDMDNPFNMLREMGVDKLVNKAVETVEDEVMKQKRKEAKNRMAGDDERPAAIVTHYGGAAPPPTASPPSAPSAPSPQAGIPMGFKNSQSSPQSPTQADTMTPSQPPVNGYPDASQEMSKPVPQPQTGASSSIERNLNSIMKRVSVTEQAVPLLLSRISRTEEAVEELTDSVHELVEGLKGARPWGERASRHKPSHYNKLGMNELNTPENSGEVYYEIPLYFEVMMKLKDLTGQKFGRWTVIERAASSKKQTRWLCRCECGTEKIAHYSNLAYGSSKSCGCARAEGRRGENHPLWKGGRYKTGEGYIRVKNPKYTTPCSDGYALEHREIMAQHLNRPLHENETVHHKNGIKHDNRLENLELFIGNHGTGQTKEEAVTWAKEILKRYEPESLFSVPGPAPHIWTKYFGEDF